MGQNCTFHQKQVLTRFLNALTLFAFLLTPFFLSAQISVSVSGTNVSCFGGSNGSATATATGGWQPYTYTWSNGATTQTITGLPAGTYSVTVIDIDLAVAVGSINITQPPQLGVNVFGESQICGLAPDGKATAVPYGGTPPYAYLWNTGGTSAQITGLPQGTYTVTVTDAKGCTTVGSTNVYFWDEGLWVTPMGVNVTCFGQANGSATAMVMSGTPPYTYQWSNNGGNVPTINNLAPGVYTVTVTDVNQCTHAASVTITQPTQVQVTTNSTAALCGLTGTATATVSGGTGAYTYQWSNGSTQPTINVGTGTYTVTVKDGNNCAAVSTVTVSGSNSNLNLSPSVLSNAGCTVGGSASVNVVSGGSGNYAYTWSNGQLTQTATNLSATTYTVTVTDITSGCTGTATVSIPAAPALNAAAQLVSNATCATGGSATASGSGGTQPYTYKWDNNQTTATATNLSAGPHVVTVTDAKGCTATAMVTIGQSQGPTVVVNLVTNATCTTGGAATAVASGGLAPYTYLWSNGNTTATATNLMVGTAKVTVTDANGCAATGMINITQPSAPTLVVSSSTPAGCTTGGTGTVAASGGTSPYTYKWSNGATTASVSNLPAGSYTITVTDAAGCTATSSLSIAAPLPPAVVITASSNANCNQPGSATASASGGVPPFTYKWSNGETTATASNLQAGTHTVTVTGSNGCTATATVTIGSTANGISIGDYVWLDLDQDGFQDPVAVETPVANFNVALIRPGNDGIFGTADDVTVATTTTNASGLYQFNCVVPGTYILKFSGLPAGYEFTGKDQVNNDCKDSDVKANGQTDPFTIVAGQGNNFCFDAGIHVKCENVIHGGQICCDQTICEGETPAQIYNVQLPPGGVGPIEYVWMQFVETSASGQPIWTGVPNSNGPTLQPGPLFQTTSYMRCARREGCVTFLESNIVTITVNPAGSPGCPSFIVQMNVQQQGPTAVTVNWTTLPEGDQYMYAVQHSNDNINWASIGTVMGAFNPSAPNEYSFTDQTPANGANYYRIKRTNSYGTVSFSTSLKLDMSFSTLQTVMIAPNPVVDKLNIRNTTPFDGEVSIQITGTNGVLINTVIIPQGTIQQIELPVADLPQGMYLARVRFPDGQSKTLKITKF